MGKATIVRYKVRQRCTPVPMRKAFDAVNECSLRQKEGTCRGPGCHHCPSKISALPDDEEGTGSKKVYYPVCRLESCRLQCTKEMDLCNEGTRVRTRSRRQTAEGALKYVAPSKLTSCHSFLPHLHLSHPLSFPSLDASPSLDFRLFNTQSCRPFVITMRFGNGLLLGSISALAIAGLLPARHAAE